LSGALGGKPKVTTDLYLCGFEITYWNLLCRLSCTEHELLI
jgi:hypothetical protein